MQEPPLRRILVASALMTAATVLTVVDIAPSAAKPLVTPAQRCTQLGQQLDEAMKAGASATRLSEVGTLRKQAYRFCVRNKRAQGIRTYAKALKLLGVTPIDSDQQIASTHPKT